MKYAIFVFTALVIIADFIVPGRIVQNEILQVKKERQQHYNASGNAHYAYKVITDERQFWVEEDFAESVQGGEKIEYSVSRVFKKINGYRLLPSGDRAVHSFRIASGLVLPLLAILSILIAYRSKKNIDTVVFVLQALLIANLIYLLI